jgi:diguanylate cyclase (GGDEF)-like protein
MAMGWQISQARVLAATNATNEAILRTQAEDELFQRVCDAAVDEGGFTTAATLLPDAEGWLQVVAISGHDGREPLTAVRISVDPNTPFGNGLAGTAFRTGRSCLANDFQSDERFRPWRERGVGTGLGALAAVPILRDGVSIGVFLFLLEEANVLDDSAIALLERMVENVSFALKNFERDRENKATARANRRVTDMFAALSATNTAILRAKSAREMFQGICESVAAGGKTLGACAVLLAQPGTDMLKVMAAEGVGKESLEKLELSTDPDHPNGQGLAGPAFREQKLMVSYDLLTDTRTKALASQSHQSPYAGAAVPLIVEERSVGILYFFFGRTTGKRDEELLKLMQDIADNVSFGLQMFEREEQKQSIARMYAALSATNEAIMRAKSRDELFQMVTRAAGAGGRFTSTSILLADENDEFFTLAASDGPRAEIIRSRRYSPREDRAEGRGLTGTAFRTGEPCIRNDVQANERLVQWPYDNSMQGASRSGAALPLFSRGKVCGVLLFMGAENDTFTLDFVELLKRMAENVSFALESFELADEKRLAEEQIQHMATHDGLTGLPNRALFNQHLQQSIKSAVRHQQQCAVLFVDLDRFKVINDSLGHAAGDTLLVEIASRLCASIRASDVVARLGGDEFVVLLNDLKDADEAAAVARKISSGLAAPFGIGGYQCRTTASIGIAMFPDHGDDAQTLTKHADMAMYLAKEEGRNDLRFFSANIKTQSFGRPTLESLPQLTIESPALQPATTIEAGQRKPRVA